MTQSIHTSRELHPTQAESIHLTDRRTKESSQITEILFRKINANEVRESHEKQLPSDVDVPNLSDSDTEN